MKLLGQCDGDENKPICFQDDHDILDRLQVKQAELTQSVSERGLAERQPWCVGPGSTFLCSTKQDVCMSEGFAWPFCKCRHCPRAVPTGSAHLWLRQAKQRMGAETGQKAPFLEALCPPLNHVVALAWGRGSITLPCHTCPWPPKGYS